MSTIRIKTVVLLFLASLCVILLSTMLALDYIRNHKKSLLQLKQKNQDPKRTKASSNNSKPSPYTKTRRSNYIPDPETELQLHTYRKAPDSNDFATVADAYFGKALQFIPFERVVRKFEEGRTMDSGVGTSPNDIRESYVDNIEGNAIPSKLYFSNAASLSKDSSNELSSLGNLQANHVQTQLKGQERTERIGILGWISEMSQSILNKNKFEREKEHRQMMNSTVMFQKEREAMYFLEQAAEMGNSNAQHIIANSLVSGILPINNSPELRRNIGRYDGDGANFNRHGKMENLKVSSDFSEGNEQLARGLLLWHMSAMDGNIEAAMSLGYRHLYSAKMGNILDYSQVIPNEAVQSSLQASRSLIFDDSSSTTVTTKLKQKQHPLVKHIHNPISSEHYGVLGSCESALTYYEVAASAIMDELESSPLRAKVTPAIDQHHLAEIHQRGASSALEHHNKPDELDEALKYYAMRASRKNPEPDINSAYKLATFYHYGLNGVKQDMKLALKYYEIAADFHSWEAAGQAGKFHFWMMGLGKDERNLKKAHKYFSMGMPGGLIGCKRRLKAKTQLKKTKNGDELWDEAFFEKDTQCDHPCVNGMGLLHLFGVPYLVDVNVTLAVEHFRLAQSLGNMDAMYNLGMIRLGWMNSKYGKAFEQRSEKVATNSDSPNVADYKEALSLFNRASQMGHIQAKFRLASLYSRGVTTKLTDESFSTIQAVPKSCPKALAHYKEIADSGTKVSQRMRVAYKQYTSGEYDSSLRNYLAAAETGNVVAQVNAAFLMEEGHCLGIERPNCLKASVRMWRAAARQGNEEACLRVGDFYYYGRLRNKPGSFNKSLERETDYSLSPAPWIRYVLYPEDLFSLVMLQWLSGAWKFLLEFLHGYNNNVHDPLNEHFDFNECSSPDGKLTCDSLSDQNFDSEQELESEHLVIAAHYYRKAAEKHESARANFNLGFMHEWGHGLSQDFPLAKRHYDLAAKQKSGEGMIAVQIALFSMNIHEGIVKCHHTIMKWFNGQGRSDSIFFLPKQVWMRFTLQQTEIDKFDERSIPLMNAKASIIMKSVFWSWESSLILVLSFILIKLFVYRRNDMN